MGNNAVFSDFLSRGGQDGFWKPKDGKNIIRILSEGGVLPSDWVTPYPFILSGIHPRVGLSLTESVYCPRLTEKTACPICAFVWKLYKSNSIEDQELAKAIKSYSRVLANIIDLSDVEKGVQVFAFGKKLAGKIISYLDDPDYMDLLDPNKGRNFILIKDKVDNFPNYDNSRPEVRVTLLSDIYPKWKENINDLKKNLNRKSYDELVEVLNNTKRALLTSSSASPSASSNSSDTQLGSNPVGGSGDPVSAQQFDMSQMKNRLDQI